jgi:XTP/dITP diphosphohydrolase
MHRLVLATRNAGKIAEIRRIFAEVVPDAVELLGVDHFSHLTDVEETGQTFAENALLKARTVCRDTGLPVLADDSGLSIDALNGLPGIFSARWSGTHGNDGANIAKVLSELRDVPGSARGAHFTCVTALVLPDGSEVTAEGILSGEILNLPIGNNGFGYDPIFRPAGSEFSLAQMEAETKDAISHRGQSLRAIAPRVASMLGGWGSLLP